MLHVHIAGDKSTKAMTPSSMSTAGLGSREQEDGGVARWKVVGRQRC